MATRTRLTPPFNACPTSIASWLAWGPTARSSLTTSAESRSGQAISRAVPSNSPGSDKRRGGAGTNEQVPRILPHPGGLHRRGRHHPRHRDRTTAGAPLLLGDFVALSSAVHRGRRPDRGKRRDGLRNQGGVGLVGRTRKRRCAG